MHTRGRVFISYAREDGKRIAERLHEKLSCMPDLSAWLDLFDIKAGVGWWNQISEAIEEAEYFVLVITPGAAESEIVRREWMHARREGTAVCPVFKADSSKESFIALPRWMSKVQAYNVEEQWDLLIGHLRSPSQAARIPMMAPDLPHGFVERPAEFEQLKSYLLTSDRKNPVAITTAFRGAGGFGKTTLAAALCHDYDIINAFSDGILWVTLGKKPNLVTDLAKLYMGVAGEPPSFIDAEDGANRLAEKLEHKDCLIVLDDVWESASLRPFLRAAHGCACLVTTRLYEVAADAHAVSVDAMKSDEAAKMLTSGLAPQSLLADAFRVLAARMWEWPILIDLARGVLRERLALGDDLEGALRYLNEALDRRGVFAFDRHVESDRNQAVAASVGISLDLLSDKERAGYLACGIFPEDEDIPFSVLAALWETDEFEAEELARRLFDLSLLLRIDLSKKVIRLHDVMRAFLIAELHALDALPATHGKLIDAWGDLRKLASAYAWRWAAYHLDQAERTDKLRRLLLDFDWMKAKLEATDVHSLIKDYDFLPGDRILNIVQSAIRLSIHVLNREKAQMPEQLYCRLMSFEEPELALIRQQASSEKNIWLRPITESLTQSGGEEVLTLFGHTDYVTSVAVMPDGRSAISGSWDRTIKMWDLGSGQEIRTLRGHAGPINCVAVTPDGRLAISGSLDRTVKVWDLGSGREIRTLSGHFDQVKAVALTPDGQLVISGSSDGALKVWDIASGREIKTLIGHIAAVLAVAATPDGLRVVSGSEDGTLRIWDCRNWREIRALGKRNFGKACSISIAPGGHEAIAGYDWCVRKWDLESGDCSVLPSYGRDLCVASMPDGRRVILGGDDGALEELDIESGKEMRLLRGHNGPVNAIAVSPDGHCVISGADDRLLKVWDFKGDSAIQKCGWHSSQPIAMAMTPDGRRVITCAHDALLRAWDVESGREIWSLGGHFYRVSCIAITADGQYAVSKSSFFDEIKMWDLEKATEVQVNPYKNSKRIITIAALFNKLQIISQSGAHEFCKWDLEHGRMIHQLRLWEYRYDVTSFAATPDGRYVISGTRDGTLILWDIESGRESKILKGHTLRISDIAVAVDGRCAISGSWDKTIRVWDLAEGRELRGLIGHRDRISALMVTPDGRRIISGSWDGTIKIWDLKSGAEMGELNGHRGKITEMAVTFDGRRAFSVSQDQCLFVWDLNSCSVLAEFEMDEPLRHCSVAPDRAIIAASGDSIHPHMFELVGATEKELSFPNNQRTQLVSVFGDSPLVKILNVLKVGQPKALLVLVGGAGGLDAADAARLRPIFAEALIPAAESCGAMIMDGGTDAGIMKLAGQARAESKARFPLVGIVPAGMAVLPGEAQRKPDACQLEPNHSNFILVPGNSWADESPWIDRIAGEFAKSIPAVTVLVNGGEVSRAEVELSLASKRPVIVVAGSGRLADEIARAKKLSPLFHVVRLEQRPNAMRDLLTSLFKGGPHGKVR